MAIPQLKYQTDDQARASIYALMDPRTETAIYVGVTTRELSRRLGRHVHDARANPGYDARTRVISAILECGMRPRMLLLEEVAQDAWVEAEQFWIAQLRFLGCALTNRSIGGPGSLGAKQTAKTQALRSLAAQGRDMSAVRSAEVRAKAAAKIRGRRRGPPSDDARRKMSEAKKGERHNFYGTKRPETTRAKISAALREAHPWRGRTGEDAPVKKPIEFRGRYYPSAKEASRQLGLHYSTVRRAIRRGEGRYIIAG